MEQIVVLLVGSNLVSTLLLVVKLEILAPSWAISDAPTHLIFVLAWERSRSWIKFRKYGFLLLSLMLLLLLLFPQQFWCLLRINITPHYNILLYASSIKSPSFRHHQTKTSKLLFWLS
jgi:hypothetical protein